MVLKAYFLKEYDRVEHIFIWDTMLAMGFDKKIMQLAKGLVEQANSKVHVNGRFTTPISLKRGMCQGCPKSTLLFVIST